MGYYEREDPDYDQDGEEPADQDCDDALDHRAPSTTPESHEHHTTPLVDIPNRRYCLEVTCNCGVKVVSSFSSLPDVPLDEESADPALLEELAGGYNRQHAGVTA